MSKRIKNIFSQGIFWGKWTEREKIMLDRGQTSTGQRGEGTVPPLLKVLERGGMKNSLVHTLPESEKC